jgi:hypothetical protein
VEIHGKNTSNNLDFYVTTTDLTICQKGIDYNGQKKFNNLPSDIKDKINNEREFKRLIRNFLYCSNFYSLQEYFNYVANKKYTCLLSYSCLLCGLWFYFVSVIIILRVCMTL